LKRRCSISEDVDLKGLIMKAAEFHGHLGPFLVLGIRAGLIGLRELAPEKFRQMHVTVKLNPSVPFSCFIDGIQVTTKCTVGNGLLRLESSREGISARFEIHSSQRVLTITVRSKVLKYLMEMFSKGASNERLAWEIASLPEEKLFTKENGG